MELADLISQLLDKDEAVRGGAAIALGDSNNPQAVTPLISALNDDSADVRGWAAAALGSDLAEYALDQLSGIVLDEHQPGRLRETGAWALHYIQSPRVLPVLLEMLTTVDPEAKQGAIQALGAIRAHEAVDKIIDSLHEADYQTRWLAACALGQIGDRRAVTPLLEALQDSSDVVRSYAVESLSWIGGRDGFKEVSYLALNDLSSDVRISAVYGLRNIGIAEAVPVLEKAHGDQDPKVRKAANTALQQLKEKL